ncbi:arsenate reductase [Halospina denitrificans]|uniref:Arsenate reductase n=1 Tax=Halospina denitrificans TaxID=332522 RepID=A0A4R7JQY5_9GAMM|nr:arsenate reductase (thioredoxin) [Halospina denitrificans]TDT40194.1 arsenate reductase [Halospina denitrificans]
MNILFLCTGNSCRSQMAEGFLRHLGGDRVAVDSAGLEAHGQNPRAIKVMDEVGVDIYQQQSTVLTNVQLQWADLVVTVCGDADESCPILPPGTRKLHWGLPDPARARGDEETVMSEFRRVRDDIEQRVQTLLQEVDGGEV